MKLAVLVPLLLLLLLLLHGRATRDSVLRASICWVQPLSHASVGIGMMPCVGLQSGTWISAAGPSEWWPWWWWVQGQPVDRSGVQSLPKHLPPASMPVGRCRLISGEGRLLTHRPEGRPAPPMMQHGEGKKERKKTQKRGFQGTPSAHTTMSGGHSDVQV